MSFILVRPPISCFVQGVLVVNRWSVSTRHPTGNWSASAPRPPQRPIGQRFSGGGLPPSKIDPTFPLYQRCNFCKSTSTGLNAKINPNRSGRPSLREITPMSARTGCTTFAGADQRAASPLTHQVRRPVPAKHMFITRSRIRSQARYPAPIT